MKIKEYLSYFEAILQAPQQQAPYSDPEYLNYTKLNWSRTNRWFKKFEITDTVKEKINAIDQPQHWVIITESRCGDAAHSVPQIVQMAQLNPLIKLDIQLRDSEPFLINDYLTNGGKSIPKWIIRNDLGEDLWTWGPRPQSLQAIYHRLKEEQTPFEQIKETLQKWYNEDKGIEIQNEFLKYLDE